jgi:3D (Asp-Asp-Asp) domain-containing protein/nuclear transport factor 2 (NTF2) superfamily protein
MGIVLPASGGGSGGSPRQHAQRLSAENMAIASRSRSAVLNLYALDSRLSRAEAQLASVRTQSAAVDRQAAETRRELKIAKGIFSISQRNLANRLRSVYEQSSDSDPLAIVLGAKTLDDALTGLETEKAAAQTDRAIVAQARRSRDRFVLLQHRLASRAQELHRLEASVAATTAMLASAKAGRISYLQELATRRRLNQAQIRALDAQAQAIEAQARRVAVERVATETAPPTPAPTPAPVPATGQATLTVTATAYTLQGHTATGAPVGYGVVAVDPGVIPLGTRMTIPGYGEGVAADTGGAIQGAVIDLWFPTAADAANWGRRTVTITLH